MAKKKKQQTIVNLPDKQDKIIAALLGLALVIFYGICASPTVTLEDSGEFILMANFLGIAHPPGYPTYTLLGKLFTLLPFGSIAFRLHIFSAVAAALCCSMIYLSARILGSERIAAVGAALLLAFSITFWNLAQVAEVYALNSALYFCCLFLALKMRNEFSSRGFYLLVFLLGLSLTNHYPLIIINGLTLLVILYPARENIFKHLKLGVAFFMAGLLPILYLWLRSLSAPLFTFSGKLSSFAEAFGYFALKNLGTVEASMFPNQTDLWQFFLYSFSNLFDQFGPMGLLLVSAGLLYLFKERKHLLMLALLLSFVTGSLLLNFILPLEYDDWRREIFRTYQLIPLGALALASAFVRRFLARWLSADQLKTYSILVFALAVGWQLVMNFSQNYRAKDTFAADYAELILKSLPTGANLFVHGDMESGPIAYLHHVEKKRPDIKLYSENAAYFGNRLYGQNEFAQAPARITAFINQNGSLFSTDRGNILRQIQVPSRNHGLFVEMSTTAPGPRPEITAATKATLDKATTNHHNQWQYFRDGLLAKMCLTMVLHGQSHRMLQKNYKCKLMQARFLARNKQAMRSRQLLKEIINDSSALTALELSEIYADYISISAALDNTKESVSSLLDDTAIILEINQACNNRAAGLMMKLARQTNHQKTINIIQKNFGDCR